MNLQAEVGPQITGRLSDGVIRIIVILINNIIENRNCRKLKEVLQMHF